MSLFLSISLAFALFSSFLVLKLSLSLSLSLSLLFHIKINYFLIVKFSPSELKGDDDAGEAGENWASHLSTCFSFQICLCKISRHCSSLGEEISDSTVFVLNSRPGSYCRVAPIAMSCPAILSDTNFSPVLRPWSKLIRAPWMVVDFDKISVGLSVFSGFFLGFSSSISFFCFLVVLLFQICSSKTHQSSATLWYALYINYVCMCVCLCLLKQQQNAVDLSWCSTF